MSDTPIPQTEGLTWSCHQIWWPDGDDWAAILRGLLTIPTRGRWWDADTGSILAAQAVGWEIFERNYPFLACAEDCPPAVDPETVYIYVPAEPEEEDDMSNGLGPCCPPLKIEDGILYWFDKSCGWVEVGPVTGVDREIPDEQEEPIEGVTYSACGKAQAVVAALRAVTLAAWDTQDGRWTQYLTYFQQKKHMQDASGLELRDYYMYSVMWYYALHETLGTKPERAELEDEDKWDAIACALSRTLGNDASGGFGKDKYNRLRDDMPGEAGFDVIEAGIIAYSVEMVGRDQLNKISATGARDLEAECCQVTPSGTYFEEDVTYSFSHFSPNTSVDYDEVLSGNIHPTAAPIAMVVRAAGVTEPNGQAKLVDFGMEIIVNTPSPYSRDFALYANSEGQSYLALYYPALPAGGGGTWDNVQEGTLAVNITGNQVNVAGSGTISLVYRTADVYG